MISHAARLAPFQPETVWMLRDGTLVETCGLKVRGFALSDLTRFRLATARNGGRRRVLQLSFGRDKIIVTAQSYLRPGRFEDRLDSFSAFARTIARQAADTAPAARFSLARIEARPALTGAIGLLSVGTLAVLASSLSAGMAGVGIDLAARMGFVLILLTGALPWLTKGDAFDPRDPPRDLLP
ncbi:MULTISPECIES: hypothetical protein [unclassified Caulobacter]|uniref:hypothetical protein n=1 Tax=unclassified Caulobacter TaxID=2648921 RepID=UPI000D38B3B9|nr:MULTISPECIES: hypothetical protein [unclassified Caulobacter]PTS89477.1 hypothetical protein DBR21_06370 [Caulobacter sp. HMWF009]PTT06037.1 hypothetical protein DBR10_13855 [Caulobacter sp. HMWF025]